MEKIKEDRTIEVQKDVFEMAMRKISRKAEIEMIDLELGRLYDKFGKEIDFKTIGVEIN